jgi:malic enzyme
MAAVIATGRSDFPNQINNVLAFPGLFRGALDVSATDITENMKLAAAVAIAESVSDADLAPGFVVPSVFDRSVVSRVAPAVSAAAIADGVIGQRGKRADEFHGRATLPARPRRYGGSSAMATDALSVTSGSSAPTNATSVVLR